MKLYQNIEVPGQTFEYEDEKRKQSKFWNEGKWHNFIEPLLPKDCTNKTFVEIGSSAGLFLKMAEDKGFGHVVGVEADKDRYKEAEIYKNSNGGKYTIIHEQVDEKFNFNTLPIANVVLIANTHYYFSIINFSKLVDALRTRCAYCIIVSAKVRIATERVRYDLPSVRRYFGDWKEIKTIEGIDTANDPSPREGMYGVLFKGALEEYDTEELYSQWVKTNNHDEEDHRSLLADTLPDFYKRVLEEDEYDFVGKAYYNYWKTRRPDYDEATIVKRIRQKAKLAKHVQEHGMFNPIYTSDDNWRYRGGRMIDGQHRLVIAYQLGYKTVLVRRL